MNNVFVYCELEGTVVAEVSLELLTKGRKLANQLGCQLEAVVAGTNLAGIEKQVLPFGVDRLHIFDAPGLFPYTSLPHSSVLINLFKEEKPKYTKTCCTRFVPHSAVTSWQPSSTPNTARRWLLFAKA